jgi:chromosomal replication initiator protein
MSDQHTLMDHEDLVVLKTAWESVLKDLKGQVPETVLTRFLKRLEPVELREDCAVFNAPGRFVHDWVKDRYIDKLQALLIEALKRPIKLELRLANSQRPTTNNHAVAAVTPRTSEPGRFKPIERLTFDNFVVGQSNRLAVGGAKAIATAPGTRYNPLFIYGPSGLGKTHLLHAIANELLERDPYHSIMYVTAAQFMEDFVTALKNNQIERFRRQQRGVNVWLLDDIQYVAGKDKTLEEIFHTFNYLQSLGKQIVLCSDRPPRDLLLMDERLRSRFESGLVVDVQHPDTETKCAILLKRADVEGINLDQETAMALAEGVNGTVRHLEGALHKMAAQSSLTGQAIDIHLANEIVERYYANLVVAKPSFEQILNSVSKHYRVEGEEIIGISRKAHIAQARHVAIYITREILGDSWKQIGALFGNKDHTSMMHGYKKVRQMMNQSREMNASVRALINDLYPNQ